MNTELRGDYPQSDPTAPGPMRRCNFWGDFRRAIVCLALRRQSLQNQQPVESCVALHCRIDSSLTQVLWGWFMRKVVRAVLLEAIATPPLLSWMSLQAP
jgi:hypothetical protein